MKRTKDNIRDPLFRFFEREVNLGAQLVQDIRKDLQEVRFHPHFYTLEI